MTRCEWAATVVLLLVVAAVVALAGVFGTYVAVSEDAHRCRLAGGLHTTTGCIGPAEEVRP